MKKFILVNFIFGMLMTWSIVTIATADTIPKLNHGQIVALQNKTIKGPNDKRMFTPQMNWREKVETWRNLKKRAAAKRNQLIQQAAIQEKQQKKENIRTDFPSF